MVGVDLMTPWEDALIDAGYETVAPSVWLLEGLLVYLDESTVLRLLDCVTKLTTPNSWLGADVVNNAFLKSAFYQTWSAFLDRQGASWKFASDRPESLLSSRGWKAKVTQPGEEGANFGRWPYPVLPREIPDVPRSFLIQASQNRPR
jgi:methyltransferase (TIGR00027 family)